MTARRVVAFTLLLLAVLSVIGVVQIIKGRQEQWGTYAAWVGLVFQVLSSVISILIFLQVVAPLTVQRLLGLGPELTVEFASDEPHCHPYPEVFPPGRGCPIPTWIRHRVSSRVLRSQTQDICEPRI